MRRIVRRLDWSRRYSRRTVGLLLDAVWRVTNSAEIVTTSLAIHLAGYRTTQRTEAGRTRRKA